MSVVCVTQHNIKDMSHYIILHYPVFKAQDSLDFTFTVGSYIYQFFLKLDILKNPQTSQIIAQNPSSSLVNYTVALHSV